MIVAAVLAAALVLSATTAEAREASESDVGEASELVTIHGNRVLIDEIYLSVLRLPKGAGADEKTAATVKRRMLRFLRNAGYMLASVEVAVEGDKIVAEVDEGRLEKVVFLGRGSITTLQLKLALNLPQHVFNKPLLERQIERMKKKFKLRDVTYRVVLTNPPEGHEEDQLVELENILGTQLIVPSAKYELHIIMGGRGFSRGLGFDIDYDYPDGLAAAVDYKEAGLLLADDRLKTRGLLGGMLRERLDTDDPYVALSHVLAEARWYFPPLIGKWLRPNVFAGSDLTGRQRADLVVEMYFSERAEAGGAMAFQLSDGVDLSLGGGYEHRIIFGIDYEGTGAGIAKNATLTRPFAEGRLDVVLQPWELRLDRSDKLTLKGRQYWRDGERDVGRAAIELRKLTPFGWHDLWLKFGAVYLWGDPGFDDDEPVGGSMLRGVFGTSYYTTAAAVGTAEFRYSLTRDLIKVSLFHDLAVFSARDRMNDSATLMAADSVGVGFHALLLDTFQLNIYYAVGFSTDGEFGQGSSASLEKVF